jgi:GNAT superfamily N-acetyltransferase
MKDVTITYLEMHHATDLKPRRASDPRFEIHEVALRQWQLNRFLYQLVGRRWDWTEKVSWTPVQWQTYLDSGLKTVLATLHGSIAGYYELCHDQDRSVQIAYFGLVHDVIGGGFGGALLTDAIERAWAWGARRVWVHTCTLDHPAAIKNYQARGMTVYQQRTQAV